MAVDPPLKGGHILSGSLFSEPMRVETVRPGGNDTWVVGLVGTVYTVPRPMINFDLRP